MAQTVDLGELAGGYIAVGGVYVTTWGQSDKASPWQPIETAPKDGRIFLAYDPEIAGAWAPPSPIAFCRWDAGVWVDDAYTEFNPTHWMLLPEPPVAGRT
jgi:hypothetical protein